MKISSLVEVISAIHLSERVRSDDNERGGLMLIAGPGSLKTSMLNVLQNYSGARILSDLTIRQAVVLREDMQSGNISTLAFSDYAKLYQRKSDTAQNIEGFIKSITGEGFRQANWEDPRMAVMPSHCAVIGCMTSSFEVSHASAWLDDGFARRFLWCRYRLDNPEEIMEAKHRGKQLDLTEYGFNPRVPTARQDYKVTEEESRYLETLLRDQPGDQIPLTMLRKILTILRWKFSRDPERPMAIIKDFAPSLRSIGTRMHLPQLKK